MNFIKDTYHRIVKRLSDAVSNEKGQTAVEYALVVVLVAIMLAIGLQAMNSGIETAAENVNTALGTTPPAPAGE